MNLTTAVRERLRTSIPLEDLLPDHLPAFMRSPAYFFGMISLSSLVFLILSGIILAAFGPQWWHNNAVGHFVNSLHFWCSEAFFFSMTLHLWTEFFKGAWRHGRRLTWVSGGIIFVAGIGTAFTGYVSQTNFDAQWIAVAGKDAINSIGIGAFNLLNFGQMYGFHIVLLPLLIVSLVGMHLLLVRIRGIVRPYAPTVEEEHTREVLWRGARRTKTPAALTIVRPLPSDQASYYRGIRMMPYDLIREGLIALLAVFVLVLVFAAFLSSPDEPPLTLQQYAQQNPVGFVTTAMKELGGTSLIAQYGPPYNQGTGSVQFIGPISLQQAAGVTIPIDVAHAYVLEPLAIAAQTDPQVATALQTFTQAGAKQQSAWEDTYTKALSKATGSNGHVVVSQGDDGPIPAMMDHLLTLGTSGALDGLLLSSGGFYQNDFTKPLLFLSEDALPTKAGQLNLLGTQWGVMNETGNYPGQAWLWLYTFWYQIPPYNTSSNADALVLLTMGILTALLVLFPYLPYLNRLPYYLGVHRLIWREYYRDVRDERKVEGASPTPAT
ncbi:MAG: hypothetical protein NVSMB27_17050 [Ktedonobacteraceae bacterium]